MNLDTDNMTWRFLFLIGFVFPAGYSGAQDYTYRSYVFQWDKPALQPAGGNGFFSSEPIYVIEENYKVLLSPKNDVIISGTIRMKVRNDSAVSTASVLRLPIGFDPLYENSFLPFEKQDLLQVPWYFDLKVVYCTARIIRNEKTVIYPKVKDKVISKEFLSTKDRTKAFAYVFQADGLKGGDEIEYVFKYMIPPFHFFYRDQQRFFLHSSIPKLKGSLTFEYYSNLFFFFGLNGMKAGSHTTDPDPSKPNFLVYQYDSLAPVELHAAYMIHEHCPFVSCYIHWGDFGEMVKKSSGEFEIVKLLPYTWSYFYWMYKERYYYKYPVLFQGKDKELILDDIYNKESSGAADTSLKGRIIQLHNQFSRKYKYWSRNDRIIKDDFYENFTTLLKKNIIYQDDVMRVYEEMFERGGVDFFRVAFSDKRIEKFLSILYLPPLQPTGGYAIKNVDGYTLLLPKFQKHGYWANELPYYLEGTSAVMYRPFNNPGMKSGDPALFINTPKNSFVSNMRTVNAQVNINLDSNSAVFNTRVSLSGQFSTMNRFAYIGNFRDSSVAPIYGRRISDMGQTCKLIKQQVISQSDVFPYKITIKSEYKYASLLNIKGDSLITMPLRFFFPHIIKTLSQTDSSLPVKPDFGFQDRIKYIVIFNHKVTLLSESVSEISNVDSTIFLRLDFKQAGDSSITLDSFFLFKTEVNAKEGIFSAMEIFRKIRSLDTHVIYLRRKR